MTTAEDLRQNFQPHFMELPAAEGYENVTLVSSEKKFITISACVFASVNPWCCQLLKSVDIVEGSHYFVITELSTEELMIFKTFATTGKVFGFKSAEELLADQTAVDLLTFGYGSFGYGSIEKHDYSFSSEPRTTIDGSANVIIKVETTEEAPEESTWDPLQDNKKCPKLRNGRKKKYEEEEPTTMHVSLTKTDNYSKQYDGVWGEELESDVVPKSKRVKKSLQVPYNKDRINHWRQVAKIVSEKPKPYKELADGEIPITNPDGSVSFPNGYCIDEWKVYWRVMRNGKQQANKAEFTKHLVLEAFGKELTCPVPQHLKRDLSKACSLLNTLTKNYRKSAVKRRKVCFTISPWSNAEENTANPDVTSAVVNPDCSTDVTLDVDTNEKEEILKRKNHRAFSFPAKDTQNEAKRDNKTYQCHLCAKGYNDEKCYQQHLRRHDAQSYSDKYFCLVCPGYVAFSDIHAYRSHNKEFHPAGEPYREVQCELCPRMINNQSTLPDGKTLYHTQRIFDNNLKLHMQSVHGNPDGSQSRHMCVSCGKSYNTRQAMLEHIKRIGPFHDGKCRLCPDFEAKKWPENLTHLTQVHQGERQYKCGQCPAHFPSEIQYREHRRKSCDHRNQTIEPTAKEVCSHCGITVTADYMDNHIKKLHGSHSIPCQYEGCKVILKHPDLIKEHIRRSHTYTTCELCGKTFQNRQHFKRHMNMAHTDNDKKRYKCETCGKGFAENSTFKDHMNIHLGLKPHVCKHCNAGFASGGTLMGHIRAVHRGIKRKT